MIAALPFRSKLAAASIGVLLVGAPAMTLAEGANPPPSDPPAVITAPADPPPSTGLLPTPQETIGAIGKFIDQSISTIGAGEQGAGEPTAAATDAAREIANVMPAQAGIQ